MALLFLKANRRPQAWLILLPAVLVSAAFALVGKLLEILPGLDSGFMSRMATSLTLALSAVWLLSRKTASGSRRRALLRAFGIVTATGILVAISAWSLSGTALAHFIVHMVFGSIQLIAMMLATLYCRKRYTAWRYTRGLVFSCLLVSLLAAVVSTGIMMLFTELGFDELLSMPQVLVSVLLAGGAIGVLLTLILLPFMALAFKNAFYRERFYRVVRPAEISGKSGENSAL